MPPRRRVQADAASTPSLLPQQPQPQPQPPTRRSRRPQADRQQWLTLILLTVWCLPALAGVYLFEDVQSHKELAAEKVSLPLQGFDSWLRHYGSLLTVPAVLLRLAAWGLSGCSWQPAVWVQLLVYGAVSATRLGVYELHVRGAFEWLVSRGAVAAVPVQYMSDHIFLSGSIVAILAAEVTFGSQLLERQLTRQARALAGSGVCAAVWLYGLVAGDMFYTARYFHFQRESLLATAVAAAMFVQPVYYLCRWTRLLTS